MRRLSRASVLGCAHDPLRLVGCGGYIATAERKHDMAQGALRTWDHAPASAGREGVPALHAQACGQGGRVGALLLCRGRTATGHVGAAGAAPVSACTLTAMLTFPRISSGILLASFSTWSREPPSWGQHRAREGLSEQAVGGAAPEGRQSRGHENAASPGSRVAGA